MRNIHDDGSFVAEDHRLTDVLQEIFHEFQRLHCHPQLPVFERRIASAVQGRQDIDPEFRVFR